MSTATIEGATHYYEVAGSGSPVVLIHGALVDSRSWDAQFEEFSKHHRTVRYDIRGWGRSLNGSGVFSVLRDLAGLLDHLQIPKASLVGLSMGGVIALEFALHYPARVDRLVLAGSGFMGYEQSDVLAHWRHEDDRLLKEGNIAGAVELSLRFWTDGPRRKPSEVDPDVRERIREMTTAVYTNPPDEKDEELPAIPSGKRLEEVRCPVLLVAGEEDVEDVHHAHRIMAARIPNADTLAIAGGAHHFPMEVPDLFNAAVLEFLSD